MLLRLCRTKEHSTFAYAAELWLDDTRDVVVLLLGYRDHDGVQVGEEV